MNQNQEEKILSYEYIRGLIEGEGCFTFTPVIVKGQKITSIPTFVIAMSARDKELIEMVKQTLGLRNKIYCYKAEFKKDGYKRQGRVILKVRDTGQLKNIIVPLFYKRLAGNKGKQFSAWLEKIGNDPLVAKTYKFIYEIYKAGFYDRNPRFVD